MDTRGLLFIPDISGFTSFINSTEVNHSRHIISELLEKVIDANILGLKISEVEGDAILFYRYGPPPAMDELYNQVKSIFQAFHKHLLHYENSRICNCGACASAPSLSLKIITHYGEFTNYVVKQFDKLIGRDVIVAHRLLKNEGIGSEYWLLTKNIVDCPPHFEVLSEWKQETKSVDGNSIHYHYTDLSALKADIEIDDTAVHLHFDHPPNKVLQVTQVLPHDMYALAQVITNLSLRPQWLAGVKEIRNNTHGINQIGNKHECVLEDRCDLIITRHYEKKDTSIHYSEIVENMGEMDFLLKTLDKNRTELTIRFYLAKNWLMTKMFLFMKKRKMENDLIDSIRQLDKLMKKMPQ